MIDVGELEGPVFTPSSQTTKSAGEPVLDADYHMELAD
jgi:hypothetical protein